VKPNGLALCSLHHKLFDRGAFTLSDDREILVSELAQGESGLEDWLLRHHRRPARPPQRREDRPDPAHLRWHRREVFRGDARE
jgi:putative restriction endonuclease